MKKKYLILVLAVLVIIGGLVLFKDSILGGLNIQGREAKKAWSTFETYLAAAKAHDLEKIRGLSHQLSDACQDSAREAECFALMDNVYAIGSTFTFDEFKHSLSDDRQLILHSDYETIDNEELQGLARKILLFTKTDQGDLKLIGMSDLDGAFVLKREFQGENASERLNQMTLDSDSDAVTDEVELCSNPIALQNQCKPTDPSKRDSDGDGWWDGIDALIRQG